MASCALGEWLQHGDTTAGAYEIFNLGGRIPSHCLALIRLLEASLGYTARIDWQAEQPRMCL